ncbi:DNA-binding transcriptional regulator, AcrR family [Micromonospora pallida]|uniref:DNA-binding transcriptional regulator, AcrR family n=1 Tax=Micromonospora pallida TaxID=145854 RepID=A0A1C6S657_9ACTN|nr:TetR/AcrR family transcriptional regulator [Micromonospora pallida]SCL24947.1 DNA-binding transcriptional regulator, AcrR family [Micromonospora pallida]
MERLTRAEQQQRTRRRLLDAAESLIADRGIHATSLEDIATAAQLTKGAIYANFAGKKALMEALLERRLSEDHVANAGHDGAGTEDTTSLARWLRYLGLSFEANTTTPEVRRFVLTFTEFWLHSMRQPESREIMARWMRSVRTANAAQIEKLTDGDPPLPAEDLAAMMLALDIGVLFQNFIDPEGVSADVYTQALDLLIASRPQE